MACQPNKKVWLADITYLPTQEGFLYLALILDTHSRRIFGWSNLDSRMRTELVVGALEKMAVVWRRRPVAGLPRASFRSRRPPVHGDLVRQTPRRGRHRVPSMGRTGTALDNAMAESLVATLKTELLVHRRRFPDREAARSAIFEYLQGFYNRRRLHSALSYRSPVDYEEATMEGAAVA